MPAKRGHAHRGLMGAPTLGTTRSAPYTAQGDCLLSGMLLL